MPHRSTRIVLIVLLAASLGAADSPHGSNAGAAPTPPSLITFAPMLKEVEPCVVSVYSSISTPEEPTSEAEPPFPFPLFGPSPFEQVEPQPRLQHGLGSGVIISNDGYILTNAHVVEHATEIKVRLTEGGDRIAAKLIGDDPRSDLAVLKVDASGKKLPVMPFGDSDRAQVGDLVFAVGNPFAVGETVTMGIISATRRGGLSIEDYEDFIQTDAAVNPGNSGGALVTSDGKLVGINTAIISPSGGNLGIGFAIPIGMARTVMDEIIKHGKVSRGYLGVHIQALTPDLARALKLSDQTGVLVSDVEPGGPAAKAGIAAGDVILGVNGTPVQDPRRLRLLIGGIAPGGSAKFDVLHAGKQESLDVTLDDLAKHDEDHPASIGRGEGPVIGVRLADLDSDARQRLSIPKDVTGALVVGVEDGTPAAEAGIDKGDVITTVDGANVDSADAAAAAIHDVKKDALLLRVWREGGSRFVVVNAHQPAGSGPSP